MFYRILAIVSSGQRREKQLLVYWIVYSSLICIEYLVYSLLNALYIYWLAKCIFLLWFMKYGCCVVIHRYAPDDITFDNLDEGENNS